MRAGASTISSSPTGSQIRSPQQRSTMRSLAGSLSGGTSDRPIRKGSFYAEEISVVFLISMVPVIELRGAIPIGLGMGRRLPTYFLCVGKMLPVPFIYLFARKFLIWGYNKRWIGGICRFFVVKGEKAGRALEAKAGKGSAGAAVLCGDSAAGYRCLDRDAGRLHPGHEIQGCADRLHGVACWQASSSVWPVRACWVCSTASSLWDKTALLGQDGGTAS